MGTSQKNIHTHTHTQPKGSTENTLSHYIFVHNGLLGTSVMNENG